MRSFTLFAALASAFIPSILAQQTVPSCVLTCIGSASALTSCQSADAQCLCSSQTFIDGVSACLIQSCDENDLAIGVGFGEQYCASIGVTVSIPSSLGGGASETASASSASETESSASATSSINSASASSAISSAASSASQSIAASGTTGSPAVPTQTGAASTLYAGSAIGLVGVGVAALLF